MRHARAASSTGGVMQLPSHSFYGHAAGVAFDRLCRTHSRRPLSTVPGPGGLLALLEGLDDLLDSVLDGVGHRRTARLLPDLEDDLAAGIPADHFLARPRARHPASPEPCAAARLPGVGDVPLERQIGPFGGDLPSELGLLDPPLVEAGSVLGRVPEAGAFPRRTELLDPDRLVGFGIEAFHEVDPVGLFPLDQLVVVLQEGLRSVVVLLPVIRVDELLLRRGQGNRTAESEQGGTQKVYGPGALKHVLVLLEIDVSVV